MVYQSQDQSQPSFEKVQDCAEEILTPMIQSLRAKEPRELVLPLLYLSFFLGSNLIIQQVLDACQANTPKEIKKSIAKLLKQRIEIKEFLQAIQEVLRR